MAEKLGLLVSSDKHLDYVINLTHAAHDKGKDRTGRRRRRHHSAGMFGAG